MRFLGSDFQINADSGGGNGLLGNQQLPQVATLSDGRFAVVYQSVFDGISNDQEAIAAIFNTDGSVSSVSYLDVYNRAGNQSQPVLAKLPSGGGFGVVFTNQLHADATLDANPNNITFVRVAANGTLGTPLAIGDLTNSGGDDLFNPAIATLADGRQVVAFERVFTPLTDDDVLLNVVSADGLTTQFNAFGSNPALGLVGFTSAFEGAPAVAAIGNSALIVYQSNAGDPGSDNILGRIFDGASNTLGSQSITIANHSGALQAPKIAALDNHRYVIVYQDFEDFFGRIYDTAGGGTLSSEFPINVPVPLAGGYQALDSVAATADGGFIVTWQSNPGTQADVVARRFNSDGAAMGRQFTVNRLTDSNQANSSVAVSGANAFFTWTDTASRPGDTSPNSVRGQVMSLTTPPDFNDNGVSDVLWRNASGALAVWDMNKSGAIASGGFVTAGGAIVAPDASYGVAAISDFSGDGKADVLWRNTSGALIEWLMNGSVIAQSSYVTSGGVPVNPDPSWSFVGAGDFNGDARADILWRNDNGALAEWFMKGTAIVGTATPSSGGAVVSPDAGWTTQAKPTDFA